MTTETVKPNAYSLDAYQVMFAPLWNATHLQWLAGCFFWAPQPTRVFSRAIDLSSVFGLHRPSRQNTVGLNQLSQIVKRVISSVVYLMSCAAHCMAYWLPLSLLVARV